MNHSVIHSLRPGVDLKGRYYQNDTKSMKSVDKSEENLKKEIMNLLHVVKRLAN